METRPPDVLVLVPEWPERALLRAQLMEAGYEGVAIDALPIPRLYRLPGLRPRAAIVDLREFLHPRAVLDELQSFIAPNRIVVIAALGTPGADDMRRAGHRVVVRPTSIRDVVAAAADALRVSSAG